MTPNSYGSFEQLMVALQCDGCLYEKLWVRSEYEGGPRADSCKLLAMALAFPSEDRPEWVGGKQAKCAERVNGTAEAIAEYDKRQLEKAWADAGQASLFN